MFSEAGHSVRVGVGYLKIRAVSGAFQPDGSTVDADPAAFPQAYHGNVLLGMEFPDTCFTGFNDAWYRATIDIMGLRLKGTNPWSRSWAGKQ